MFFDLEYNEGPLATGLTEMLAKGVTGWRLACGGYSPDTAGMIDWTYIQSNFDWAGHIVEAIVMAGIVGFAGMVFFERRVAILIGLAFAGGHFHGREKRDYEISVDMPPPHLDGYLMWRWSWDQMTDFWPVAVVVLVLSGLLYRRWFKSKPGAGI